MANRNTQGFGLIPAGRLGGNSIYSRSRQVQNRCSRYARLFTTVNAVKISNAVMLDGRKQLCCRYLRCFEMEYSITTATTLKPTFANFYKATITPANSEDINAFVMDDPFQAIRSNVQMQQTTQAGYLATYDMNTSAGDDTTGKSSATFRYRSTRCKC